MRKYIIVVFLLACSLFSSGCVLGMAALIRWDQRRWKAQQEKERVFEEQGREEGISPGSGAETSGGSILHPVPESVSGEPE